MFDRIQNEEAVILEGIKHCPICQFCLKAEDMDLGICRKHLAPPVLACTCNSSGSCLRCDMENRAHESCRGDADAAD